MRKIYLLLILIYSGAIYAQMNDKIDDKVLFTVEDDTITAGEYIAVYNKNRTLGQDIDPKTPREYLDLYINFKLKVHHAKELGMDTSDSFVKEYNTYRNQLAKPYLSDKAVAEELVRDAYDRMQKDVRAAHILISLPEGATEVEEAKAKGKIEKLRERALNGEDFSDLASQYSTDTYSAERGGDLGYFTVFNMIYPFETAAYNLKTGEISEPIRTQFGYHIVKKLDERPARGTVEVAHIMVVDNEGSTTVQKQNAEQKINEIYAELEKGANFGELAKSYSEDKNSARNNGLLPPFGINKMFPEFEEQAFSLNTPGEYSKPFKTSIGWHIIQLVNKEGIPPYNEVEREIKTKVERDSRSQQSHESIIRRLKSEYNFREYPEVKSKVFKEIGESFVTREFDKDQVLNANKVIFEFSGKKYTVGQLSEYLEQAQMRQNNTKNPRLALENAYDNYSESQIIAYEKSRLEEKYPEFELLAREYYEGILLFNLTEEKVWRKSVSDTTGLEEFFEKNRKNYKWDTRYDAVIVNAINQKIAKKARKLLKKGKTPEEVMEKLNEDSQLNVSVEKGIFEKGAKEIEDFDNLKVGLSNIKKIGDRFQFIQIREINLPAEKLLEDTRGLVISDYQNYLEKQWLDSLKKDYDVNIDNDVLKSVITILDSESP